MFQILRSTVEFFFFHAARSKTNADLTGDFLTGFFLTRDLWTGDCLTGDLGTGDCSDLLAFESVDTAVDCAVSEEVVLPTGSSSKGVKGSQYPIAKQRPIKKV